MRFRVALQAALVARNADALGASGDSTLDVIILILILIPLPVSYFQVSCNCYNYEQSGRVDVLVVRYFLYFTHW